jgi:hypothetical protein
LAVQVDQVPLDPKQFSYRASTSLPQGGAQTVDNVQSAVQVSIDPNKNIDTAGFVSAGNRNYSAGAFMTVTYQPIMLKSPPIISEAIPPSAMDFVSYRLRPKFRKNVPNAGLKLLTPTTGLNNLFPLGLGSLFYPAAGIAPEFDEEYQELIIERRMLNPNFDITQLAAYQNCVDQNSVVDPLGHAYHAECLRFARWETEYVQVPTVDNAGNQNGYSRWLNLTLAWDWRTNISQVVCDKNGAFGTTQFVSWNHVLAYPGTLSWILSGGNGLAWYYCKFSAQSIGLDTPAFPYINTLVPGGHIFDPLTITP